MRPTTEANGRLERRGPWIYPMQTLEEQVRRARRRLILQSLAVRLAWFWTAALAAAALAIGIFKIWPGEGGSGPWALATVGAGLLAGTLAAVAEAWRHRPSMLATAVEIDRRYCLKERVSSCLALDTAERETSIGLALVHDAQRRLAPLEMSEQFGFGLDRRALLPLAPAAALALAMLVPARSSDAAPDRAAMDRLRTPARALVQKLAARRKEAAEKGLKEADLLLTRLETSTQALADKKDGDHKQTLLALNELVKTAEQRRQQLASPAELKQQFARLKSFEHGPGDKLAAALKSGDLQKAVQELDALKRRLTAEQLDAKSRQDLARQLEQVRAALAKESSEHQQARAELGKQVEAQRCAGNAQAADDLQRQLDKLSAEAPRAERMSHMAEQLRQAAGAVSQGQQKQAAAALSSLGAQLQSMREQLAERELLDGAMAQVSDCKSAMACQECQGQGCAACQAAAESSAARASSAQKKGWGRGVVPRRGDESPSDARSFDSQVKQDVAAGAGVVTGQAEGPNRKGQVREQIREQFTHAEQQAAEALSGQRLPHEYRQHAQEYFDSLREGQP